MTDSKELLPCPFCGGAVRIVEGEESAYVQCENVKMHRALWFEGDNNAANEVAEQWNRRAAARVAPEPVAVKPLEWRELTSPREDGPPEPTGDWEAASMIGAYYVHLFEDHYEVTDPDGEYVESWCGDPDEARAAAQADYEARIRSALVASASPQGMEEARRAAFEEAAKLCEEEAHKRFRQSDAARLGDTNWGVDTKQAEIVQGSMAINAKKLADAIRALTGADSNA